MPETFFSEMDLNGAWVGHYSHRRDVPAGRRYAIAAEIECRSGRIAGTMRDDVTEIRRRYEDIVELYGSEMDEAGRANASAILSQDREAVHSSSLPSEARLAGRWDGHAVRFTKTYLGDHASHLEIGARIVPLTRRRSHRVEYEGELDSSGRSIRGRWFILRPGLFGRFRRPMAIGDFVLEKRR